MGKSKKAKAGDDAASAAPPAPRIKWTSATDADMVAYLLGEHRRGNSSEGGFKGSVYTSCAISLTKGGFACKNSQVRTRYQTLKAHYKTFRFIRHDASGFGWDEVASKPTAGPDVWDNLIKSNPKRFGPFRDASFPLYDQFAELVDGSSATGAFALSSETGAAAANDEQQSDSESSVDGNGGDPSEGEKANSDIAAPEDDQELQERAPSTPVSKTKRQSADPLSVYRPPKRKRASVADSMAMLTGHIGDLLGTLSDPDPTPVTSASALVAMSPRTQRKNDAFRRAVDTAHEAGISNAVLFADYRRVFRGPVELAEEYMSFKLANPEEKEAAAEWMKGELARMTR